MGLGSPIIALAALGAAVGVGMLGVFRWTSNPEAIRRTKARIMAHLYEMRLFPDEPLFIWKAQAGLLATNARYLGLMLLPALVMSLPGAAVYYWLDGYFGYRPLAPGTAAILTVQLKNPLSGAAPAVHSPRGIDVETPGVRLDGGRQISWRIRASQPASGKLEIVFPDETVEKSVEVGAGPRRVSGRRVSTLAGLFSNSAEPLLKSDRVDWVEIRYPEATVAAAGLDLPWAAWLLFFSMIAALGLKNRFGVTF
jgi:hypothetical protein